MTTPAKLLPCPFCGWEAYLFQWASWASRTDARRWRVSCSNTGCMICPYEDYEEQDRAVAAWNTRAPKDQP